MKESEQIIKEKLANLDDIKDVINYQENTHGGFFDYNEIFDIRKLEIKKQIIDYYNNLTDDYKELLIHDRGPCDGINSIRELKELIENIERKNKFLNNISSKKEISEYTKEFKRYRFVDKQYSRINIDICDFFNSQPYEIKLNLVDKKFYEFDSVEELKKEVNKITNPNIFIRILKFFV